MPLEKDEIEGFHLHALETGGFDGVIEDDLQVEGLLQKARQVEKIEVKYATKAKKVDVRRLKQVMWEHIDEATQVPEERAEEKQEEGTAPKAPEAELAFSGVLGQLVPKVRTCLYVAACTFNVDYVPNPPHTGGASGNNSVLLFYLPSAFGK